jgi:hypothetical protein
MHRVLPSVVASLYIALSFGLPPAAHARRSASAARTSAPAPINARARTPAHVGITRVLQLTSAPNPAHPEVLVHAPAGFDPAGPLHLAVFLHGWRNCVRVLAGAADAPCRRGGPDRRGADLVAQFDRAQVNALLVVPQLAFDRRSSEPGQLATPGGFRALLTELLAAPALTDLLGGPRTPAEIARLVLLAHSGGYVAAAAVLEQGEVDVHEVHLLDALYRDPPPFEAWARAHLDEFGNGPGPRRRLVSLYTTEDGPGANSRALVARIAQGLPAAARVQAVRDDRSPAAAAPETFTRTLIAQHTDARHGAVPSVFLTPLLQTAGLPRLARAPALGGGRSPRGAPR